MPDGKYSPQNFFPEIIEGDVQKGFASFRQLRKFFRFDITRKRFSHFIIHRLDNPRFNNLGKEILRAVFSVRHRKFKINNEQTALIHFFTPAFRKAGVKKWISAVCSLLILNLRCLTENTARKISFPRLLKRGLSRRWMMKWLKRFRVISNRKNFRSWRNDAKPFWTSPSIISGKKFCGLYFPSGIVNSKSIMSRLRWSTFLHLPFLRSKMIFYDSISVSPLKLSSFSKNEICNPNDDEVLLTDRNNITFFTFRVSNH